MDEHMHYATHHMYICDDVNTTKNSLDSKQGK